MNRKCVARQKSKREELALLRKKDRASVQEIVRLHKEINNVREASRRALEDVTAMCETLMVAAMDGREEIVIYPGHLDLQGKVLGLFSRQDWGISCRLVDPSEVEREAEACE